MSTSAKFANCHPASFNLPVYLCPCIAISRRVTAVCVFEFDNAVVRTPGRSVVRGILKNSSVVPEFDRVVAEHAAYVEALRLAGLNVEILPPLEAFPDSVFVEDPALVFTNGAVLLRPGAPTRLGESDEMRPVLQRLFKTVLELSGQQYADGGDVLTVSNGIFIGLSRRTNRQGAEALSDLLADLGLAARIIDTPVGSLHLKSAVSVLDEDTVLTSAPIEKSGIFHDYKQIISPDEEPSAHALRINDIVFVPVHFPRTADLLSNHGYAVTPLQVTEIRKLDAGLPCMSLRWRSERH
jgi:dimethylargininase